MTATASEQRPVATAEPAPTVEVPQPSKAIARIEELPPREDRQRAALLTPEAELESLLRLAQMMLESGFMPKALKTPAQVVTVILAGRELGIPPMMSIRSIGIIDGKPVLMADLLLGAFKRAGGRSKFRRLDENVAELYLRHPNGDEHVETFTIQHATRAGLMHKDNWKKYPKAMLRSRVITAGLKSIGWEPAAGIYDPEELEHLATAADDVMASSGEPSAETTTEPAQTGGRYEIRFPFGPHKDREFDEQYPPDHEVVAQRGTYVIGDEMLLRAHEWADRVLTERIIPKAGRKSEPLTDDRRPYFEAVRLTAATEIERRALEADDQRSEANAGNPYA